VVVPALLSTEELGALAQPRALHDLGRYGQGCAATGKVTGMPHTMYVQGGQCHELEGSWMMADPSMIRCRCRNTRRHASPANLLVMRLALHAQQDRRNAAYGCIPPPRLQHRSCIPQSCPCVLAAAPPCHQPRDPPRLHHCRQQVAERHCWMRRLQHTHGHAKE
jgi:hypothetical protein